MSGTLIYPANYDAYAASVGYPGSGGSGHSISSDPPPRDGVEELRAVVEEITGKPVARTPKKIGFY